VLVRNQSLPVSHMSGSSMYRSIGVSIPITSCWPRQTSKF
jgi:hypothetical protein